MNSAVKNNVFLFDADAHVLEPPDLWENYLEAEFQHRAIKFEKNAQGIDQLYVDNEIVLPNCAAALGGAEIEF